MSALPPEVHAAHGLHKPDLSPVPKNRESRLRRPGSGRTPVSAAPDGERTERGSLPRVGYGTFARRADDSYARSVAPGRIWSYAGPKASRALNRKSREEECAWGDLVPHMLLRERMGTRQQPGATQGQGRRPRPPQLRAGGSRCRPLASIANVNRASVGVAAVCRVWRDQSS